jgi:hypothetical protein
MYENRLHTVEILDLGDLYDKLNSKNCSTDV